MFNFFSKVFFTTAIGGMLAVSIYYFAMSKSQDPRFSDPQIIINEKSEKILADTKKVEAISFDTSLFSDKRFTSMRDTRVPLQEVPSGRRNPFEPLQ